MLPRRLLVLLGIVSLSAACGGGGGGSSSTPLTSAPTTQPTSASGTLPASFSITIPSAGTSSKTRKAKNVPSNARFIQFTLLKTTGTSTQVGVKQTAIPIGPGVAGCTAVPTGTQCILNVSAPVGEDIYNASIFDANMNPLGSGAVNMNVALNQTNNETISLGGAIAYTLLETDVVNPSGYYVPGPNQFGSGGNADTGQGLLSPSANTPYPNGSSITGTVPTQAKIYLIGVDVNGNQIIAPDDFTSPVTLTLNAGTVDTESHKRRVKGGSSGGPAGTLSVTYAYPNMTGLGAGSEATTSANESIAIYSPADAIVFTPANTDEQNVVTVTASAVSGSTATAPPNTNAISFFVLNGTCPNGDNTNAPYNCGGATPSPSPSPYPVTFVPGSGGTDPEQSYQYDSTGTSAQTAKVEFPTVTDTNTGVLTTAITSGSTSADTTFTMTDNGNTCGSYTFKIGGVPLSLPATFPVASQISITQPGVTAATQCGLTLTGNADGAQLFLNIYTNNSTGGTVQ